MLAYLTLTDTPGAADRALCDIARALAGDGLRLAGAVQTNHDRPDDCNCDMDLTILGDDGPALRISQALGRGSSGCRLDNTALATAVGRAGRALARGADLVIVNKFGRQEARGSGFRDLIAQALADDTPVLVAVAPDMHTAFADFAGDLACAVTADTALDWCRSAAALRGSAA